MTGYWKKFTISLIAMAVAAATEPAFARLMKPLIDKGFTDQDRTAMGNSFSGYGDIFNSCGCSLCQ